MGLPEVWLLLYQEKEPYLGQAHSEGSFHYIAAKHPRYRIWLHSRIQFVNECLCDTCTNGGANVPVMPVVF